LAAMYSWFATYGREFEKLAGGVEHQKDLTAKYWRNYQKRSWAVGKAFADQVIEYSNR
ncbi:MAG: hypothetical protein RLZZ400_120, partial [Actinomycetota bacterium]